MTQKPFTDAVADGSSPAHALRIYAGKCPFNLVGGIALFSSVSEKFLSTGVTPNH